MKSKSSIVPSLDQIHHLEEAQEKYFKTLQGCASKDSHCNSHFKKVTYKAPGDEGKGEGSVDIHGLDTEHAADVGTVSLDDQSAEPTKQDQLSSLDPGLLCQPYALPSFKLNNSRFNQDIINASITNISLTVGIILLVPLTFYFLIGSEPRTPSLTKRYVIFTIDILVCIFHPLQFFVQNQKLRCYIVGHFVKPSDNVINV